MGPPAPGRGKSPQAACCALCVHRGSGAAARGDQREACAERFWRVSAILLSEGQLEVFFHSP
jgi:hypothetical protein